jgi:site-specific DNA-methyltransferase (adenine-specific)
VVRGTSHGNRLGARPNQIGVEYESFTGYPHNALEFNVPEDHLHPTQKPAALFEYLIKTYTNEGEVVLDNCSGSGTTAIAALNSGRKFICIEKDDKYHAIGVNRVKERHEANQPSKEKVMA